MTEIGVHDDDRVVAGHGEPVDHGLGKPAVLGAHDQPDPWQRELLE